MSQISQKISLGGVKKGKADEFNVITAHRLDTGEVVYFQEKGLWAANLQEAKVFSGEEAVSALAIAEQDEALIVGPYPMAVKTDEGAIIPDGRFRLRENIRLSGPTVPSDFSASPASKAA